MFNKKEKKKLKIIFMGTSDFAEIILQSLLDKNHSVIAVVTQPTIPTKEKRN